MGRNGARRESDGRRGPPSLLPLPLQVLFHGMALLLKSPAIEPVWLVKHPTTRGGRLLLPLFFLPCSFISLSLFHSFSLSHGYPLAPGVLDGKGKVPVLILFNSVELNGGVS